MIMVFALRRRAWRHCVGEGDARSLGTVLVACCSYRGAVLVLLLAILRERNQSCELCLLELAID